MGSTLFLYGQVASLIRKSVFLTDWTLRVRGFRNRRVFKDRTPMKRGFSSWFFFPVREVPFYFFAGKDKLLTISRLRSRAATFPSRYFKTKVPFFPRVPPDSWVSLFPPWLFKAKVSDRLECVTVTVRNGNQISEFHRSPWECESHYGPISRYRSSRSWNNGRLVHTRSTDIVRNFLFICYFKIDGFGWLTNQLNSIRFLYWYFGISY